MALMLPYRPHADATGSEKLVFSLIAEDSNLEDHVVLHSVGLARSQRKSYAECDFVTIGPTGVHCLEVKGGHVAREAGMWRIGPPGRQYTSEEGPFKQAQAARGTLLAEIRARCGPDMLRRVPVGWGVVFPDIVFEQEDPEWEQDCIFDKRDRNASFAAYIARLANYTRKHEAARGRTYPGNVPNADIKAIVESLRADFDLVPQISDAVEESHAELIALSTEQFSHLNAILHPANPRVLCEGSAGTGKTLLAAEAARRLAERNSRVLFVCFNRNLAWHLNRQEFAKDTRTTVTTISSFLHGVTREHSPNKVDPTSGLAQLAEHAENALVSAIDRAAFQQFDVLIVDEAQDILSSPVMNALDWCIPEGMSGGRWCAFLDTAVQDEVYKKIEASLYERLSSIALNLPLTVNMRNPRAIVHEASRYVNIVPPPCRRELVAHVDYRTFKASHDVKRAATALLTELIRSGAKPSDVVLLSFRKPSEAFFADGFASIGREVQILDGKQGEDISGRRFLAASLPAFKGLESDIVIIGDVPTGALDLWQRTLMYVGLTRARTAAYIICSEEFVQSRMRESLS